MRKTTYRVTAFVEVEADSYREAARLGKEKIAKEDVVCVTTAEHGYGTKFVNTKTGDEF